MIKSLSGIVAAVAFLCCCSQAEAGDRNGVKLMGDRPGAQGPEWVLYEELPADGEIVSFYQVGDMPKRGLRRWINCRNAGWLRM